MTPQEQVTETVSAFEQYRQASNRAAFWRGWFYCSCVWAVSSFGALLLQLALHR